MASPAASSSAAANLVAFCNPAPPPATLNDANASHYAVACLLWRVKCSESLILRLCGERGLESIADFANFYTLDAHEKQFADEVTRAGLMEDQLQTSMLRSAWQLARAEHSKAMESMS